MRLIFLFKLNFNINWKLIIYNYSKELLQIKKYSVKLMDIL